MPDLAENWRTRFMQTIRQQEYAGPLKEATLQEHLGDWTRLLTGATVASFQAMGWQAAAKSHLLNLLPISRNEYLGLDVMAFAEEGKRWRWPVAVAELENSLSDDRIAYSLWKVLCVRSTLRVVFCYRRQAEAGRHLVRFLAEDVVQTLSIPSAAILEGETLVIVGGVVIPAPSQMVSLSGGDWSPVSLLSG